MKAKNCRRVPMYLSIKHYLVNQARFHAAFDSVSKSRFFEPISVSLGGSKNRDSTVAFIREVTLQDFILRLKSKNHNTRPKV